MSLAVSVTVVSREMTVPSCHVLEQVDLVMGMVSSSDFMIPSRTFAVHKMYNLPWCLIFANCYSNSGNFFIISYIELCISPIRWLSTTAWSNSPCLCMLPWFWRHFMWPVYTKFCWHAVWEMSRWLHWLQHHMWHFLCQWICYTIWYVQVLLYTSFSLFTNYFRISWQEKKWCKWIKWLGTHCFRHVCQFVCLSVHQNTLTLPILLIFTRDSVHV